MSLKSTCEFLNLFKLLIFEKHIGEFLAYTAPLADPLHAAYAGQGAENINRGAQLEVLPFGRDEHMFIGANDLRPYLYASPLCWTEGILTFLASLSPEYRTLYLPILNQLDIKS